MPAPFTKEQQEEIRELLFHAGMRLCRTLGVQRMTVSRLAAACGIAKGSFYSFFESKEAFILALWKYACRKREEMFLEKLDGRLRMTTREFFEFFREYLRSEFDFMNGLTIDDFVWLRAHMADADLFNPYHQLDELKRWLSSLSDVREDIDFGAVVNLIKSIYALRKHSGTLVEASLEHSIELILRMLEIYISGKGELL